MIEGEQRMVLIVQLEQLKSKITKYWQRGIDLFNDQLSTTDQESESPEPTKVAREEILIERISDGLKQFTNLFNKGLEGIKSGDATYMKDLFELAAQSYFAPNFLDGESADQMRAIELKALTFTFQEIAEEELHSWQNILQQFGVLKKNDDVVSRYRSPNDPGRG